MDVEHKITKIFSQEALFSKIIEEFGDGSVILKLLSTTWWTARTGAIDAILNDYSVLLEVLEEIHATTKDEAIFF